MVGEHARCITMSKEFKYDQKPLAYDVPKNSKFTFGDDVLNVFLILLI